MKTCQNCRYGDRATDGAGAAFYWCRLIPPHPLVMSGEKGQEIVHSVPSMKPSGWCGQFKLAFFRWLANFGRRGT
jgi:hypothetical protein